jgi:hypothetical protein
MQDIFMIVVIIQQSISSVIIVLKALYEGESTKNSSWQAK